MDQEDRRIRHTIRMTDSLQVVMDMYYAKAPEVTYGTGTFLFDGIRLKGSMTPMGLEMSDGDTVDYFPIASSPETMFRSGITVPVKVKVEKEDDGKTPATRAAGKYITLKRGTGRFLYDGRRLRGWQTPEELKMEDGDEVDFFEELIGGAAGSGWAPQSSMLA
uniref:Ubiquitin-like domain-containing protein n=1 Tax=Oryza punctata TaxID=4537 RepID=A0A0E0LMI6_ORYPU